MKPQYQKPITRDLGDAQPLAEGACYSGSVAKGDGVQCLSGGAASGISCFYGATPGNTCGVGGIPSPLGGCDFGNGPASSYRPQSNP